MIEIFRRPGIPNATVYNGKARLGRIHLSDLKQIKTLKAELVRIK
jgi:hypothetical protein